MQYSITINQKAIIDAGLKIDFTDAAIIDYMIKLAPTGRIATIKTGRKIYYWFAYGRILDDLPMLGISKAGLYKRIKKLESVGLIDPHPENRSMAKSFFHLTEIARLTQFTPDKNPPKPIDKSKKVAKKPTEKSKEVSQTYGKKLVAPSYKSKEVPTEKSKEYHNTINHNTNNHKEVVEGKTASPQFSKKIEWILSQNPVNDFQLKTYEPEIMQSNIRCFEDAYDNHSSRDLIEAALYAMPDYQKQELRVKYQVADLLEEISKFSLHFISREIEKGIDESITWKKLSRWNHSDFIKAFTNGWLKYHKPSKNN